MHLYWVVHHYRTHSYCIYIKQPLIFRSRKKSKERFLMNKLKDILDLTHSEPNRKKMGSYAVINEKYQKPSWPEFTKSTHNSAED